MLWLAAACVIGGLICYLLGRQRPSLTPIAAVLMLAGLLAAVGAAALSMNPAARSMRAYHNMHQERQAIQAEAVLKTLMEAEKPPGTVVFMHNSLATFSDSLRDGLDAVAKEGEPEVISFYGGSEGLDPETNVSGYIISTLDVVSALKTHPNTDLFLFDGLPPSGAVAKLQAASMPWVVLSAPHEADVSRFFDRGMLLASQDLPPTERGSALHNRLARGVDKAFKTEFILRRP